MFRIPVRPHEPPPGARPFPELKPIVERRIAALELSEHESDAAKNTLWTQRTILRRALKDLPAAPVPADVRAWVHGLVSRWGCSLKTANKYRDTLSTAYEFDRLRGGEVNNPCADVKRLRAHDPLKPALTAPKAGLNARAVYQLARDAMPGACPGPLARERERAALGLWYVLGLRRSEVCGLEESHFDVADVNRATVRLAQQRKPVARDNEPAPLKSERRRVLPLPLSLAQEIQRILKRPAWVPQSAVGKNQFDPPVRVRWVFPFNTDDLQAIHEAIRSVAADALPPGRGVHEFRHAFAEAALHYYRGDLKEVGRRMGHSSEAVTAAYARGRYGTHEIKRDPGLFDALEGEKAGSARSDFPQLEDRPSPGQVDASGEGPASEKRGDSRTQKVSPKPGRKSKKRN